MFSTSLMARDFPDDPFMGGQMDSMRRMESIMDSMMVPFGGMFNDMGMMNSRQHHHGNALMPFGFGRSLFPSMGRMFNDFSQINQDPNCHSFSSSSVMTYTTDATGQPQMYQATSSTRVAPGGVKETRETVHDSRSGLQKMAIGHHLNDKAHVVEKKKFRYTGDEEENHEYINLDDEEADTFDNEWQQRAHAFQHRRVQPTIHSQAHWRERSPEPNMFAITDGTNEHGRYVAPRPDGAEGKKKVGFSKKKGKHGQSSSHKSSKHQ